ncbi:hypothetical protein [Accumulibacter sp.]|uniref:Uncharacterized protein n=1 Tax=Accumulibacter regalis TaxID=522306 RepID=C7RTR4_ACCRE|nr:hypothetical protein [Accumulibacter sp.]MBN8496811.1 hypothetical protein [Accumulibacter sp.]
MALRLGEVGDTQVDDLWIETAPGVSVPTLIQHPVEQSAMSAFAENLAKRSALKFAACLPTDLAAAVLVGRSLDEANFRRLVSG